MNRKWPALLLLIGLPACVSLPEAEKSSLFLPSRSQPITREVLENGLTVLVKEVHRMPVVSIMAYVKTGSAHEGERTGSGVSHVVEHMLFKGTETRGVGEIEKEIRSYGGDMNAFTSHDVTGYVLLVSRDHYEKALALLADCLTHARFDENEFQKEKEVILGEIRMGRDNPFWRSSNLLWQNVYSNHPYRHPVIGYESLLKQLTREEVVRYYREKYIANNTILVLVGDLETREALEAIKENFKDFERKTMPPPSTIFESSRRGYREFHEEAPLQMAHLEMGFYTVSISHEDMFPLDVLAILLGEGESSRLVQVVEKEKQLVHGIDASHYTPVDPGLFAISAVLEKEKIREALSAVREEIEKVKQRPVRKEELEKAKQQVLSRYYFDRETLQSQAGLLAGNEAAGLDPLFSERYVTSIAAVEPRDIQRVAKYYLKEENLAVVLLLPESKEKTEKKISSKEPPPQNEIQKFTLPNAIRVFLQRDTAQPIVSVGVAMLGGLRYETDATEGISNFVARILPKGTRHRDEKEISTWLDHHGAAFSPFSGQNSFGLRLKVLKKDMGEGIRFLSELIQQPLFPPEELEKERIKILADIRASDDQIFQVGDRLLRKELYRQHPYRFYALGRKETVSRFTREELLLFFQNILSPERMVITVFGDIEPDEAMKELQKHFSHFPTRPPHDVQPRQEPPLTEPRVVEAKLPKEQALLLVGFHGISLKDEDYYAFEVLTGVLSGGGGKLYTEIRDKKGQAYTLGAYPVWGLDPGHYVFYVATTPDELPEVEEKVFGEIESLRNKTIPWDEIERTQESLIGLHKLSLQTPAALSFQVALDELYELGYDRYLQYEEKIRSVSAEDLQRVASKYFGPEKRAVVRILPENLEKKD